MKLKDFLIALAKKAGMDTEAAGKEFFSALPETDVPEDVQKGIDNSLISMTDAKNNHPEIKNVYQKQSLDAIDKVLNDALGEYEFDEESKNEVNGIRSTYQRVPALIKKVAELQAKKANAGNKDKAAIQKEIDDLHKSVAAEKSARAEDKKIYDNQLTSYKINSKVNQYMNSFKTIHDELDPDVKSTVINTLLQKELQDNQAKFAFDEQGNFTLLKNDGTNFYGENHQQISPVKFIEQTLAKTKQLKVSNGQPAATPTNGTPPRTAGGEKPNGNASLIERNNQALREYQAAETNGQFK